MARDQVIPARFVALVYHDVHPGETFDYERLGRSATMYHVSEGAFRSHLDAIEGAGLRCLDASAMRACLAGAAARDGLGVVVSFDDGWRGAVECAAPILAQRRMAAFFFVTTGLIGRRFFAAAHEWRRLDPSLFTIGSHGVTHRMLSGLSSEDLRAELSDSRRRLEGLLGRPVHCLSVPGGAMDRRALDAAEAAGYDHIFTSALGMNPAPPGRRGIARIGVRGATDLATLRRWLAGDLRRERARAALLAVPKRLLGMRTYAKVRRVLLGEAVGREHFFEP
ncbi:MAG TPA: polysaccharide deacetylase family protein [Gemmatimonadales bacterium]|jgi:peptidoglycan/xylan/chitin deacetylase (PgdA/CDA1 family)